MNVCMVFVILVRSVIVCERLVISKILKSTEVLGLGVFDSRLQFRSPSKNNSKFSASILSIIFSNYIIECRGELGGLYQVPTRNGLVYNEG